MTEPKLPPDLQAHADTMREAAEGWPTPNKYTASLDALLAALEQRQEALRRLHERLERNNWLTKKERAMFAALAAEGREQE